MEIMNEDLDGWKLRWMQIKMDKNIIKAKDSS